MAHSPQRLINGMGKTAPFGIWALIVSLFWEVPGEVVRHTIYSWISEDLGERLGMHGFHDLIRWIFDHPHWAVVILGVGYCVYTIWSAELLSAPPEETKIHASVEYKDSRRSLKRRYWS